MIFSIQPHNFVFVSRCAKSFAGEAEWLYWCLCDPARAALVDSLYSHIEVPFQEFEKQLSYCLHITAMKAILVEVDAIHEISPALEFAG